MGKNWFESDEAYERRMRTEAAEEAIRDLSGDKPFKYFAESDDDYAARVIAEANQQVLQDTRGFRETRGLGEDERDFRERINEKANASIIRQDDPVDAVQGLGESDDDYRGRLYENANSSTYPHNPGFQPRQKFLERDEDYRERAKKWQSNLTRGEGANTEGSTNDDAYTTDDSYDHENDSYVYQRSSNSRTLGADESSPSNDSEGDAIAIIGLIGFILILVFSIGRPNTPQPSSNQPTPYETRRTAEAPHTTSQAQTSPQVVTISPPKWDYSKHGFWDDNGKASWAHPPTTQSATNSDVATTRKETAPTPGSEITMYLVGDTHVWVPEPTNKVPNSNNATGQNGDPTMMVGGYGFSFNSLLQFDVSRGPWSAKHAYLFIHKTTNGHSTPIRVYRINDRWQTAPDGSLAWTDIPSNISLISTEAVPDGRGWVKIDITELYNNWRSGMEANYGLLFKPVDDENNMDGFDTSDAKNAAFHPKLIITPGEPDDVSMMSLQNEK